MAGSPKCPHCHSGNVKAKAMILATTTRRQRRFGMGITNRGTIGVFGSRGRSHSALADDIGYTDDKQRLANWGVWCLFLALFELMLFGTWWLVPVGVVLLVMMYFTDSEPDPYPWLCLKCGTQFDPGLTLGAG